MTSSKKKLGEVQTGKSSIKAPTLDTINRTYRNIGRALDQQEEELDQLRRRVGKLDLGSISVKSRRQFASNGLQRDPRLPDSSRGGKSFTVSPHVAMSTAAALNAERSAHKLKQAILAIHSEPLLNRRVMTVTLAPPQLFSTPTKAGGGGLVFNAPSGGSLFSGLSPAAQPEFSLEMGDDHFQPTALQPRGRRGAGSGQPKLHSTGPKVTPKLEGAADATPKSSFDWGPLPAFKEVKKPAGSGFISFK